MQISVGSKVAYKRDWLHSTGMQNYPIARARGIVNKVHHYTGTLVLAEITWNLPDVPGKVLVHNLRIVK